MSSTPVLEHTTQSSSAEWVTIATPRATPRVANGAGIIVSIANLRSALAQGRDAQLIIETDDLREVDELDEVAAAHAASRWDD